MWHNNFHPQRSSYMNNNFISFIEALHSDTNLQNIFLSAAKIMVIALFKMTYVLYFEYYTFEMSGTKY